MRQLLESAIVRLAPGVIAETDGLRDGDGHSYPVNAAGAVIGRLASRPVEIRAIVARLSTTLGQPVKTLEPPVVRYLLDLNERGLVSIHQSFARELIELLAGLPLGLVMRTRDRMPPASGGRISRRYAPTVANVVRGCLEGHQASMWSLLVLVVLAGTGSVLLDRTPGIGPVTPLRAILLALSFFALLHWTSILVHELGHFLVARATGSSIRAVYVRSSAMGISFRAGSRRAALLVLASGAIASLAYLLLVLVLIMSVPDALWGRAGIDQLRLSIYVAIGALALAQLACFTPITRDGRELLRSLRSEPHEGPAQ
ncbi:MAG TPA: M50 family metallopeptidase [Terrimesophilobacter sp.]|nr:M50 family metallopeptidase [Terrimesophilobacter sp.]